MADWTKNLKRLGRRGATSKAYAGWHEFVKATKSYALFREAGDADLFAAAPALVEALEALTATMTDQENLEQYRDCLATPWAGPLVDARRALAAARGEEER